MIVHQRQPNEASGQYCAHHIQTLINIDIFQLPLKRDVPRFVCCAVKCGQITNLKCSLRLVELKAGIRGEGSGGLLFS